MTAILDFTMTATDTQLKMCSVQLLTSKCMFRHNNPVSIISISCDVNKYICVGYPTSKVDISNCPRVRVSHPPRYH